MRVSLAFLEQDGMHEGNKLADQNLILLSRRLLCDPLCPIANELISTDMCKLVRAPTPLLE